MKFKEFKHEPVQPDTYEASMALNQLLKIGKHAIKIHNMIDDRAEMEAWVAKKIDLAGDYVKKVHGYTQGEKAGLYDDGGMTEARLQSNYAVSFQMPKGNHRRNSFASKDDAEKFADTVKSKGGTVDSIKLALGKSADDLSTSIRSLGEDEDKKTVIHSITPGSEKEKGMMQAAIFQGGKRTNVLAATPKDLADQYIKNGVNYNDFNFLHTSDVDFPEEDDGWNNEKYGNDAHGFIQDALKILKNYKGESVSEDAGEGHMSKSQLYQTAKMAIELLDMIKKGDDLEGWVQTKLNLAADYLQAVYHYEDYQKLNPYREELDISLMQRHAGIIQKHLDEILERKCRAEDVDTKPGMMRILKKRVNEVEKEIAKENRKESQETKEAVELEEGIKEWGKRLAMAGVIVAGLAGVNSINNAIDNSIPAIKAMNTALEMAQDAGNDELAKMIEKDLSDAKVRLNSGKDLSHVADLQDKYAKFMKTEGLAYESKLTVALKQQLK